MGVRPFPFYSAALIARKTCYVYLPPSYEETDNHYPVIYLLHGMYGGETDWVQKGHVHETAERMMRSGELRESIIVMPSDGGYHQGTFYVDWYDGTGNFEQYFLYDLMPAIEREFRTIPTREARVIGGLSMGGLGSFVLSLRNPEKFGAAASLSGALHPLVPGREIEEYSRVIGPIHGPYAQERDVAALSARRVLEPFHPALYFDCGRDDRLFGVNQWFKGHLESIRYPFIYHEFAGEHDWEYWTEHVVDALRFFEKYFKEN